MNREQFKIWEKQKRREYELELEKLQENFAARGLAYSGIRNRAEADLKTKYEDEIEFKRLSIENNMADDFEKMSEDELNAIVRRNENSYVPTSRFNHAKNELEIRHRKKMEEIASRGSGFSLVAGDIKNSTISGNTVNAFNTHVNAEKESVWSKFFWIFIIGIVVIVVGGLLLKYVFGV